MRFLPANLDALLVELDDLSQTLALLASLQAEPIDGIVELVPAARTVMVHFRPNTVTHDELVTRISRRDLTAQIERATTRVEIPVSYEGEDLDEVAQMLDLSREEVIRRHTGCDYTVAFTGFAPGFAYLSGGHPSLNVPRRTTPRTRIPAGAVGLAGAFSGVYPQASPGGWQIIGVTATPMWDLSRDVPALLQPGFKVRFVDVSGRQVSTLPAPSPGPSRFRSTVVRRLLSVAPACRRCSRISGARVWPGRAYPPQGRWIRAHCARPTVWSAMRATWPASRLSTVVSKSRAAQTRWWPSPVPMRRSNSRVRTALDIVCQAMKPSHFLMATVYRLATRVPASAATWRCAVASRSRPCSEVDRQTRSAQVGPPPIKAGDILPVPVVTAWPIVGAPETPRADLPTTTQTVVLDVVMGPRTDWFTLQAIALLASIVDCDAAIEPRRPASGR